MKNIFTKSTGNAIGNVKKVFTLSVVAAIAAVPFLSVTQTAQADPPRHGWGKNDKNRRNDRWDNRRDRRDRRDDRWDRRNRYESFTGTVSRVENSRKFDLRVGGRTYNVYPNSSTRRIDRGDVVRVYGQRSGNNDIRNASVSILRNR